MELITIERASVVLRQSFRPARNLYLPEIIERLRADFGFVRVPDPDPDLDAYIFSHGRLDDIVIDELAVFAGGLAVRGQETTARLMTVIGRVVEIGVEEYGAQPIEGLDKSLVYRSGLAVRSNMNLDNAFAPFSTLAEALEEATQELGHPTAGWRPFSVQLVTAEDFSPQGESAGQFMLERRLGVDPALGIFISSAPLSTERHLDVLGKLEASLS